MENLEFCLYAEFSRTYRIAGMFGRVNVWRIAELKEIGKIKFGELIYFSHANVIYKLNFGRLKFGELRITDQICLPPNIPAIWYYLESHAHLSIDLSRCFKLLL